MSAPSAIIDTDLNPFDKTVYYAVELDKIWKATALGGGNAVWATVYDSASFTGGTFLGFSRGRCAAGQQNLVYALGFAQKAGQSGSDCTAYCFRSSSGGLTWSSYEISDDVKFSFDGGLVYLSKECDSAEGNCVTTFVANGGDAVCKAVFDGGVAFQFTECHGVFQLPLTLDDMQDYTLEYDAVGTFPSQGYDADGDAPPYIHYLVNPQYIVTGSFSVISGGYHFSGYLHTRYMPDRSKLEIGWFYGYPGRWAQNTAATRQCAIRNLTINGVKYTGQPPAGFDVAATNPNWLYVGLQGKIMASETGGVSWFDFNVEHGANDICVDPQAAGDICYWATDGNLNLMKKQTLGEAGIVTSTGLMTETPSATPLRIARDPSSGVLLALPNGTVCTRRMNGANANIGTGYINARGLHAYTGQKMIFVDGGDIRISDDIQAETPTITAKKGGWSTYSNGVNAHRMV